MAYYTGIAMSCQFVQSTVMPGLSVVLQVFQAQQSRDAYFARKAHRKYAWNVTLVLTISSSVLFMAVSSV